MSHDQILESAGHRFVTVGPCTEKPAPDSVARDIELACADYRTVTRIRRLVDASGGNETGGCHHEAVNHNSMTAYKDDVSGGRALEAHHHRSMSPELSKNLPLSNTPTGGLRNSFLACRIRRSPAAGFSLSD